MRVSRWALQCQYGVKASYGKAEVTDSYSTRTRRGPKHEESGIPAQRSPEHVRLLSHHHIHSQCYARIQMSNCLMSMHRVLRVTAHSICAYETCAGSMWDGLQYATLVPKLVYGQKTFIFHHHHYPLTRSTSTNMLRHGPYYLINHWHTSCISYYFILSSNNDVSSLIIYVLLVTPQYMRNNKCLILK